ncbi:flagellar basal body-associated FliL family protein [bacterium]|nr:flagellar basal body-associated FliL family protein [bacterium]
MAKPTSGKDVKPKDEAPQAVVNKNDKQISTNMLLMVNTLVLIVFFVIMTFVGSSIVKSTVKSEIAKVHPSEELIAEEGTEVTQEEKGILLDLGDFILNLADPAVRRYLKVNVAIELTKTIAEVEAANAAANAAAHGGGGHGGHGAPAPVDPMAAVIAEMEQYKPAIRDAVISVLSSKTADELSTPTGKEIAKEEIQDMVSAVFNGSREVLRVNFAQFIIQ